MLGRRFVGVRLGGVWTGSFPERKKKTGRTKAKSDKSTFLCTT